jgi:hypothetical protein
MARRCLGLIDRCVEAGHPLRALFAAAVLSKEWI